MTTTRQHEFTLQPTYRLKVERCSGFLSITDESMGEECTVWIAPHQFPAIVEVMLEMTREMKPEDLALKELPVGARG